MAWKHFWLWTGFEPTTFALPVVGSNPVQSLKFFQVIFPIVLSLHSHLSFFHYLIATVGHLLPWVPIHVYMMKKSCFWSEFYPPTLPRVIFLPIIYTKKGCPFLTSSRSCSIIMSLLIILLVSNDLLQRSREDKHFVSFVSAWHVRCWETEMASKMDNLCEQHSYKQ